MTRRLLLPTLAVLALAFAAGVPALADDPPPPDPVVVTDAPADQAAPADEPLLVPEGPLFTPAPKPMAPECHFCSSTFSTSPGGGAASHWGHGATCTDAQNDVRNQLSAYVNSICFDLGEAGRCAFSVVYTCSCYYSGGQWVIDAYATYRCWVFYC
jgi:hypothetical protein